MVNGRVAPAESCIRSSEDRFYHFINGHLLMRTLISLL